MYINYVAIMRVSLNYFSAELADNLGDLLSQNLFGKIYFRSAVTVGLVSHFNYFVKL